MGFWTTPLYSKRGSYGERRAKAGEKRAARKAQVEEQKVQGMGFVQRQKHFAALNDARRAWGQGKQIYVVKLYESFSNSRSSGPMGVAEQMEAIASVGWELVSATGTTADTVTKSFGGRHGDRNVLICTYRRPS